MRVRFIIRRVRINKAGLCPVNCRITIDGVKANEFAIGISVDPDKWDSKQQRVKGATQKVHDLNKKVDIVRSELDEIYLSARAAGRRLSPFEVKDIYTGKIDLVCNFSKLSELYISELKLKDRAKATIIRYKRCFQYLLDFIKRDVPVQTIDRRHVSGFWAWLRGKDYKNDYCNKIVQSCIGLFRFALREGYIEKSPFEGVSLEWKKELDVTFLTNKEVEKIKNYNWGTRLQKVADSFLFMCYTGLHISDYRGTTQTSLYEYNGNPWMRVLRVKTGVEAKFPLHSYVRKLLEKYGGVDGLPKISAQKSNDYLKLIASAVGITKNLTNKIARKTFTNMAINEYNMQLDDVAKMLGHTSTRQIKHYGTIAEDRIYQDWGDK